MPEHARERELIEEEFRKRIRKLSKGRKKQIRNALGTPPDPENIPEELWQQMEREQDEELLVLFWLAYLIGWQEMAREQRLDTPPTPTGRPDGTGIPVPPPGEPLTPGDVPRLDPIGEVEDQAAWENAKDITDKLSTGMVGHTRDKLKEARDTAVDDSFDPGDGNYDEILDDVESDLRADRVAVTETTRTLVAGERGYQGWLAREHGIEMNRVWQTERDARVCPTCSPLQGVMDNAWPPLLGAGPPAHPVCRCWITYSTTVARSELRKKPVAENPQPAIS